MIQFDLRIFLKRGWGKTPTSKWVNDSKGNDRLNTLTSQSSRWEPNRCHPGNNAKGHPLLRDHGGWLYWIYGPCFFGGAGIGRTQDSQEVIPAIFRRYTWEQECSAEDANCWCQWRGKYRRVIRDSSVGRTRNPRSCKFLKFYAENSSMIMSFFNSDHLSWWCFPVPLYSQDTIKRDVEIT